MEDLLEFWSNSNEKLYDEDKIYLGKKDGTKYSDLLSDDEKELFKWLKDDKIIEWEKKRSKFQDWIEIERRLWDEKYKNLRICSLCRA
jgi:hypothetical protein